jgi:hypothetical protein
MRKIIPLTIMQVSVFSLCVVTPFSADAHTTVSKKNTPDGFAQRSELEGSRGVLNSFTIPHGCSAPESEIVKPLRAQSIVFPNGISAVAIDSTSELPITLTEHIVGNVIMSPKPVQDHSIFKRIRVRSGPVPIFDSHGTKASDIRAFRFTRGKLDADLVGIVPFRANFPTFKQESCAIKLRINIAIGNYCTAAQTADNRADIWIGHTTTRFNDPDVVSVGFWPHINVIRDLEKNPIPVDCAEPIEITVSPAAEAIDQFLPIRGFWPAGRDFWSAGYKVKANDDTD